jgi:hypothetical protein
MHVKGLILRRRNSSREIVSAKYGYSCTSVILLNLHIFVAFAVSRTDFYSQARRNFFSRSLLYLYCAVRNGASSSIIGGGGANIHIFVFTDHKNNRFQNKLIMQNTKIWIFAPPPIIELPARFYHVRNVSHFAEKKRSWNQASTVSFA